MRKTRIVVVFGLLALFVASAASVAAALACHGPFYTNWGTWDSATSTCSGVVLNECDWEGGEEAIIQRIIVSGTSCRAKYVCCTDPQ